MVVVVGPLESVEPGVVGDGTDGEGPGGIDGPPTATVVLVVLLVLGIVLVLVDEVAVAPCAAVGAATEVTIAATTTTRVREIPSIVREIGILATLLQKWGPKTPGGRVRLRPKRQLRGTWLQGRPLSARGSPGRPSTRSPRMFFMMLVVPPSMELACTRRNAFCGFDRSIALRGRSKV